MDSLPRDVLNYLMHYLTLRDLYVLGITAKRYNQFQKYWLTDYKAKARARFMALANTLEFSHMENFAKLLILGIREEAWDIKFSDMPRFIVYPFSLRVTSSYFLVGSIDSFVNQGYGCCFKLDVPYSPLLHEAMKNFYHLSWKTISYICFRLTRYQYHKAALQYATYRYNLHLQHSDKTYNTFQKSTWIRRQCSLKVKDTFQYGNYDALAQYRRYLPDFFYMHVVNLSLTEKHWATLLIDDMRHHVGGYFKTNAEVVAFYQNRITSEPMRRRIKRDLRNCLIIYPW